jgi:phage I-like protein
LIEFVLLERQADLKKEHSEIRERGRAQEQVLQTLTQELADANMEKNRLEGVFKRTLVDFETAKSEKKDLGRFATDAQLEKANKKIAACCGRVEAAQLEHARSGEYLNSLIISRIPPEKRKMEEIVLELKRVENALAIFPS